MTDWLRLTDPSWPVTIPYIQQVGYRPHLHANTWHFPANQRQHPTKQGCAKLACDRYRSMHGQRSHRLPQRNWRPVHCVTPDTDSANYRIKPNCNNSLGNLGILAEETRWTYLIIDYCNHKLRNANYNLPISPQYFLRHIIWPNFPCTSLGSLSSLAEDDWDTNEAFFKALGSKDKVIRAADPTPDDDIVRQLDQALVLYQYVK